MEKKGQTYSKMNAINWRNNKRFINKRHMDIFRRCITLVIIL